MTTRTQSAEQLEPVKKDPSLTEREQRCESAVKSI
jgi:hypothetical protein